MTNITRIPLSDEAATQNWDAFVQEHPQCSPYHLSSWIKTIQETYDYKPILYVIRNSEGKIECVFPIFLIDGIFRKRRIISMPFSDYGGVLSTNDNSIRLLMDLIKIDCGKYAKNIEIRSQLNDCHEFYHFSYYKKYILHLTKNETLRNSQFTKRTIQYSIKKADRAGVHVFEDNSEFALNNFIRLNRMTRIKHGVPSQPDAFFNNLYTNVILKEHGFFLLAEYKTQIIAATLFLKVGKQIHYKYNASNQEFIKVALPNHKIMWEAIKKGIREKYEVLDFGRTAEDNLGLRRYKQLWGGIEIECPYSYYPKIHGASANIETSRLYRAVSAAWQLMPEAMQAKIGAYIYRYLC